MPIPNKSVLIFVIIIITGATTTTTATNTTNTTTTIIATISTIILTTIVIIITIITILERNLLSTVNEQKTKMQIYMKNPHDWRQTCHKIIWTHTNFERV